MKELLYFFFLSGYDKSEFYKEECNNFIYYLKKVRQWHTNWHILIIMNYSYLRQHNKKHSIKKNHISKVSIHPKYNNP